MSSLVALNNVAETRLNKIMQSAFEILELASESLRKKLVYVVFIPILQQ
ncbi:MAG: hypothetical protein ACREBS_06970 [Nitrososphaerales archaeon]